MWLGERKVLSALLEHPYSDPYWLGEYLGSRAYTTTTLQSLKRRGYTKGFQYSRDDVALKRVWIVTEAGVSVLAQLRGLPRSELARQYSYQRGRMAWVILGIERLTRLRWWMKNLEAYNSPGVGRRNALALHPLSLASSPMWEWQVVNWNEEIAIEGRVGKYCKRVGFTGGAILAHRGSGQWLQLLIHIDNSNLPVDAHRERFFQWLMLQKDSRYFGNDGELRLPPLAVIAQNDYRLTDYVTMLRQISLRYHLILPGVYLASDKQIKAATGNPAQPIWYNPNAGESRILLADERGFSGEMGATSWQPMGAPTKQKGFVIDPSASEHEPVGIALDELAGTALTLQSTEDKLVRLVAAHPLLSAKEIAELTNLYQSQIATSLQRLSKFGLVEGRKIPTSEVMPESAEIETDKRKLQRRRGTRFFIVTEPGERYLAGVDGFGAALARYRKVKSWSPQQARRIVREWSHSRLANMVFLKLACAVRVRGWELEWLSEAESRLYFSLNGKRHAFLPDGRGVMHIENTQIHFVVEIDTARSNADKIRRKLARYYAGVVARILPENANETLRILIVTHSTERVRHLVGIAREVETEMDPSHSSLRRVAPILFGQQQMIVNPHETIDRPTWIDLEEQRMYCFPQFEPGTPLAHMPQTGRVIYKS